MQTQSYTSEDEARAAAQLATLRGSMGDASSSLKFDLSSPSDSAYTSFHSLGGTAAVSSAAASSTAPAPAAAEAEAGPSKPKSVKAPRKKSNASKGSPGKNDDGSATAADSKSSRKRRRVVVACDTCRRKKVKCEGLPNPVNTCNNCSAYNYRCTFSSEPDRSRGKYEILESKVETLLSALRSVAPHIAAQYDKGELTITGPIGGSAPPQNADAWRDRQSATDGDYDKLDASGGDVGGSAVIGGHDGKVGRDRSARGAEGGQEEAGAGRRQSSDDCELQSSEDAAARKEVDRSVLIPDVEEGRPRYFGHSSTFSLFHSMPAGKHSRPPSPGRVSSRPHYPGNRPQIFDSYEASIAETRTPGADDSGGGGISQSVRFSKEMPWPLHPTNSKEWIQLLRRKNTVAVGRDDLNTEEWMTRYTLPAPDLVTDLLNLYFERLHPLMPIIHRPSLERDIATGRADKDVAFRGMVFMLLTIASRHSHDPRVYSDPNDPDSAGDHFAAASRLYHQVYAASLTNVQVMILTATFMHGAIGPGASWTVLGVAIRAIHDIGLHQERAYRNFTPFDQELRRRTFWGAMILDGIFSTNMGRPPGVRLEDCDVRIPIDVGDETLSRFEHGGTIVVDKPSEKPTICSGFNHMIKLNILVNDIVNILYTPRCRQDGSKRYPHNANVRRSPDYKDMAILSKRLDEWCASIPEHLRSLDSPYKLQAGLVQCGAHDVRLYILKPFLEHTALKKILHPQCSHHARECLKVVLELYEGGHVTDLVFIFQQALMSTATFMITVWHECREIERLAEDNDLIEATLRTFGSFDDRFFSKIFRRAHRILRDIATRTIHTMNSDQRERVSRLLQREAETMPSSMFASSMLLGPSTRLMPPSSSTGGLASAAVRLNRLPSGDANSASAASAVPKHLPQPWASSSVTSSIIPSWSPWGPGAQSPARGSIDYSSGGGGGGGMSPFGTQQGMDVGNDGRMSSNNDGTAASSTMATATAASATASNWSTNDGEGRNMAYVGDSCRGIMPMFTPAADDMRSTTHQLEDLTWTEYFSKFLDDIG